MAASLPVLSASVLRWIGAKASKLYRNAGIRLDGIGPGNTGLGIRFSLLSAFGGKIGQLHTMGFAGTE